jgi:hypothetical protein
LLEVFYEEDVLIVWGRLQVHKEHGERELCTNLLNIPNVGDRVAEFLNFYFNVCRIDGVVHVLQHYPVVAFFVRLISVKGQETTENEFEEKEALTKVVRKIRFPMIFHNEKHVINF